MEALSIKHGLIRKLQLEALSLQGCKKADIGHETDTGLGPIALAFPGGAFPLGAVHEFISNRQEHAAATNGFLAGLLGRLMKDKGYCLWISNKRKIFPPALAPFGIDPERIIFIDLAQQKDVLWAVEEALKCDTLSAVVGELSELSFTESRRLQLAVEKSRVTGFIHRYSPRRENTVACVTRWKIQPIAGSIEEGLPGVGFPRWHVRLLKVRNGRPGAWNVEWRSRGFCHYAEEQAALQGVQVFKTG